MLLSDISAVNRHVPVTGAPAVNFLNLKCTASKAFKKSGNKTFIIVQIWYPCSGNPETVKVFRNSPK